MFHWLHKKIMLIIIGKNKLKKKQLPTHIVVGSCNPTMSNAFTYASGSLDHHSRRLKWNVSGVIKSRRILFRCQEFRTPDRHYIDCVSEIYNSRRTAFEESEIPLSTWFFQQAFSHW